MALRTRREDAIFSHASTRPAPLARLSRRWEKTRIIDSASCARTCGCWFAGNESTNPVDGGRGVQGVERAQDEMPRLGAVRAIDMLS